MTRAADSLWSRRRAGVRAEAEAERLVAKAEDQARAEAELAHKSDADILQELSLQNPDEMQAGDDFTAFMRDEVPQRLRNKALRTLWRSNPVLACVDDLVDYGDDFKAEWNATGVIKTAYQVGKGMLAHVEEMERQQAAEAEAQEGSEAGSETVAVADDVPDPSDRVAMDGPVPEPDLVPEQLEQEQGDGTAHRGIIPKMRFDFDELS